MSAKIISCQKKQSARLSITSDLQNSESQDMAPTSADFLPDLIFGQVTNTNAYLAIAMGNDTHSSITKYLT